MKLIQRVAGAVAVAILGVATMTVGMVHAAPPSNDNWNNPTVVAVNTGYVANTSQATTSTQEKNLYLPPSCGNVVVKGVWYSFTPTSTVYATVQAQGAFQAFVAQVSGTPTTGLHVAACGQTKVDVVLQAGQNYRFLVYGSSSLPPSSGVAIFQVKSQAPPPLIVATMPTVSAAVGGSALFSGTVFCTTTDPAGVSSFTLEASAFESTPAGMAAGGVTISLGTTLCNGQWMPWQVIVPSNSVPFVSGGTAQVQFIFQACNATANFCTHKLASGVIPLT